MVVLTQAPEAIPLSEDGQKTALKIASRLAYSMPPATRQDFVQDALLEMLERDRRNGGGLCEKEMWRAARCVRHRYWRAYAKRPLSLNAPIQGADEEPIEFWETLADKGADLDAWLEAKVSLYELPPGILRIARKLEKGDPLTSLQKARLARFRQEGKPTPQEKWATKRYRELRSRGLCVVCGQESNGFARCPQCLEYARLSQRQHRRRQGKARMHTLRAHWRQQGRCPRCGRIPEPGRKKCPRCLSKNREYVRRYRAKAKRLALGKLGGISLARKGDERNEGLHKHRLGSF